MKIPLHCNIYYCISHFALHSQIADAITEFLLYFIYTYIFRITIINIIIVSIVIIIVLERVAQSMFSNMFYEFTSVCLHRDEHCIYMDKMLWYIIYKKGIQGRTMVIMIIMMMVIIEIHFMYLQCCTDFRVYNGGIETNSKESQAMIALQ